MVACRRRPPPVSDVPPPSAPIRRLAAAALAALLAPALSCRPGAAPEPPADDRLVVALRSAPIHLDPRLATDASSGRVLELVYNGLVTKDEESRFVPDLAESWEILDGARRYRFHLRPEVRFHDGRPLTARDVVWTFMSVIDGTVATPKRGGLTRIEEVREVDPLTVDFRLNEPFGVLLPELTAFMGIVPEGALPDEINRRPIGTGPFRFVAKTADDVELAAFDDAWQGRPRLDTLVVRGIPDATVRALELRKGTVHLVVSDLPPDVVEDFRRRPGFEVIETPGSTYAYLGLNLEDPLLGRPAVRRGLALAIDRELLVESLWRGQAVVSDSVLRPGHWARPEETEPLAHDPQAAARLLDEAGLTDPDGAGPEPRFALVFKTSTDETSLLQAQIIQSMLAGIGVAIEIRSNEFATFYDDIKRGDFQLFGLRWVGIADPHIFHLTLHSASVPPAGNNRGRYRNSEFDRLIEAGARSADPAERRPHYLAAHEIFARDLPYISLYITHTVAVMPAALAGYRNYPNGEFYSLQSVYWDRG